VIELFRVKRRCKRTRGILIFYVNDVLLATGPTSTAKEKGYSSQFGLESFRSENPASSYWLHRKAGRS